MSDFDLGDIEDAVEEAEHRISSDHRLRYLEVENQEQAAQIRLLLDWKLVEDSREAERISHARTTLLIEIIIALLVGIETVATIALVIHHGS